MPDPLRDFARYLNGNPTMVEIWEDALDRIEAGQTLAPVQRVVLNEWLIHAQARTDQLELRAQTDKISDELNAELATLKEQIQRVKDFIKE